AAPDYHATIDRLLDRVILPGSAEFSDASGALAQASPSQCDEIDADVLRERFQIAWDRWMAIQYLRFGPLDEENRAFAIAFWPDRRGKTGKTVKKMLKSADPTVSNPEAFARSSIAGRGFYALERLLYDEGGPAPLTDAYRCAYVAAISQDIARLAIEIEAAWQADWATDLRTAGEQDNTRFLAPQEVLQRLMAVLDATLAETAANRLGKPLGKFDKRRPRLAEARRSGRSLRQITLVIDSVEQLAFDVFGPELTAEDRFEIHSAIDGVRANLMRVREDGTLPEAIEKDPLRVEVLMQSVAHLDEVMKGIIGPRLGIGPGFNARDGD
ncbi:MAG: imelysin family protein, partial [Pseudomonadota bacterium]